MLCVRCGGVTERAVFSSTKLHLHGKHVQDVLVPPAVAQKAFDHVQSRAVSAEAAFEQESGAYGGVLIADVPPAAAGWRQAAGRSQAAGPRLQAAEWGPLAQLS